jgi:hypothetical protein
MNRKSNKGPFSFITIHVTKIHGEGAKHFFFFSLIKVIDKYTSPLELKIDKKKNYSIPC